MQFIEKNSFNVRSAVYRLKKKGSGIEFLVFPMLHVGSPEFYEEISKRLSTCDLILAEGVKSRRAYLITFSYRLMKYIRRIDLVTQQDGMQVEKFRSKLVNADIDGSLFDQRWSALPLKLRAQLFVFIPVFVVYLFLFGTRRMIAEHIEFNDSPSEEEIFEDDDFEQFESLIVQERDQKLIEHIARLEAQRKESEQKVAILFGAGHMRATMAFLMQKLKYRVVKAEWVKVFDL